MDIRLPLSRLFRKISWKTWNQPIDCFNREEKLFDGKFKVFGKLINPEVRCRLLLLLLLMQLVHMSLTLSFQEIIASLDLID